MTTRFIAEICSNHNGDKGRALGLIEAAARAGCDGVKFQLFRIDQLFHHSLLSNPQFSFLDKRRKWELPLAWLPDLARACIEHGILFGCTPFYLDAVSQLEPHVDYFKIASYELLWGDLLNKILAETDQPVMMSCGMATMEEIKAAVAIQNQQGYETENRLGLLHCISRYPTKPAECYLPFIDRIKKEVGPISWVGYSDHSVNPGVIHRAIHRYGAAVAEFHLDLDDRQGDEYGQGHCWTASEIEPVIAQVRDGFVASDCRYDPTKISDRDYRADPGDGLRPMKYMRDKTNE